MYLESSDGVYSALSGRDSKRAAWWPIIPGAGRMMSGYRKSKCLMVLLLASGIFPVLSSSQSAPQPKESHSATAISVRTSIVDLPVLVADKQGHIVDDLTAASFRVFEDGHPQPIDMFSSGDVPVTVGLVVDHSGSMAPSLPKVSAAASVFARSSNPHDQLFVVNFNEKVSIMLPVAVPFTSDQNVLAAAVAGSSANGGTALYDAIIEAIVHMKLSDEKRQALIVVTDGGDNASVHSEQQMLDMVMQSKAQIYCIGLLDDTDKQDDSDAKPGMLKKLAQVTGGETYFPASTSEVAQISSKIASELRRQYVLGFAPQDEKKAKGWREIHVVATSADGEKLKIRTRSGYFFPGTPTASPTAENHR